MTRLKQFKETYIEPLRATSNGVRRVSKKNLKPGFYKEEELDSTFECGKTEAKLRRHEKLLEGFHLKAPVWSLRNMRCAFTNRLTPKLPLSLKKRLFRALLVTSWHRNPRSRRIWCMERVVRFMLKIINPCNHLFNSLDVPPHQLALDVFRYMLKNQLQWNRLNHWATLTNLLLADERTAKGAMLILFETCRRAETIRFYQQQHLCSESLLAYGKHAPNDRDTLIELLAICKTNKLVLLSKFISMAIHSTTSLYGLSLRAIETTHHKDDWFKFRNAICLKKEPPPNWKLAKESGNLYKMFRKAWCIARNKHSYSGREFIYKELALPSGYDYFDIIALRESYVSSFM